MISEIRNIGKIIDTIKDKVGNIIYEAWKKLLASGLFPLTLNKCKGVDLVNYKLYGNSVQDGTPTPETPIEIKSVGDKTKNLINPTRTVTQGGVTLTRNNDGTYTVNGTATVNQDIRLIKTSETNLHVKVEVGKYYRLSRTEFNNNCSRVPTVHMNLYIGNTSTWAWLSASSSAKAKTSSANGELKELIFFCQEGDTFDNYKFGLMLEEVENENSKASPYEPYGYRIPVKARGKNLFNFENDGYSGVYGTETKITNGYEQVCNTNNSAFRMQIIIPMDRFKVGETYTVSFNQENVRLVNIGESNNLNDTNTNSKFGQMREFPFTFTITEITKPYLNLYFYGKKYEVGDIIRITDIQIEEGSSATEYKPYVEPVTTNIYLDEPLRKIGDYADYIDFEKGIVKRLINNIVFNGTENWRKSSSAENRFLNVVKESYLGSGLSASDLLLCDRLIASKIREVGKIDVSYTQSNAYGVELVFGFNFSTLDEMVQYVKEQYDAGTPIYVNYVLYETTEETIELPNIPTHKGTTILEVDTTIQPSNAEVKYMGKP